MQYNVYDFGGYPILLAELERKVHECNAHGLPPCTPDIVPKDTILRLEEENRKLRELLALTADGEAPEAADSGKRMQITPETAQEDLVSLEKAVLSM
jgi:hypothetical protein